MRFQMNFTTSYDDVIRFTSAEDLHRFYTEHGCDGLELMPLPYSTAEAPDVYLSPKIRFYNGVYRRWRKMTEKNDREKNGCGKERGIR